MRDLTKHEARAALNEIEHRRRQITAQIGMPAWYWWSLAFGWVGLGLVIDYGNPWLTGICTFAFGAIHAVVYGRVVGGRRRTGQLRVRNDIVGWQGSLLVLAALVGLGVVTVAGGWALAADGADHPVTIAAIVVAVMILFGGPRLMEIVRLRAERAGTR